METQIEKSNSEYRLWLIVLKLRIRQSQIKAAVRVNEELLRLYWSMGHDIVVRQMETTWGSGFLQKLSRDLRSEFNEIKGFSVQNLYRMKQFYLFYTQDDTIRHQVGGEILSQPARKLQMAKNESDIILSQVARELEIHPIFQIPWFHHTVIFTKCETVQEAMFYVQKTIENGWSRAMLEHFIDAGLYAKQGKALTNFSRHLPEVQSDLANDVLKDPYDFDFLTLTEGYKEKELEDALTTNITKFLTELGQGFAYLGRQVPIKVGDTELFIDLLFYHTELRCYVVIELKATKFKFEHTGKLGGYVAAINHQRKKETDNPTIGLLICKDKDDVMAQYSLESSSQPIGISSFEISNLLPENYKSALPSIEEIEEGLKDID
ncbi:MAG: PDDEXK nuclease domain-containing protein [Bacteroidales bacterium]|jgi:predicted nuclease of restriction endonuclease-like (RecB) superfamily|nr:PDDEXK nuclease domain-containing protein [Bacteroidales bacterium]